MIRTVVFSIALLAAPMAAKAAMPTPTDLMAGTIIGPITTGTDGYRCAASNGPASFKRQAPTPMIANPNTTVGFLGVTYLHPPKTGSSPTYDGLMTLKFTSATAGNIAMDHIASSTKSGPDNRLPSGISYPFTGYGQSWAPGQNSLKVSFTIVFPKCSLPVQGLFRD